MSILHCAGTVTSQITFKCKIKIIYYLKSTSNFALLVPQYRITDYLIFSISKIHIWYHLLGIIKPINTFFSEINMTVSNANGTKFSKTISNVIQCCYYNYSSMYTNSISIVSFLRRRRSWVPGNTWYVQYRRFYIHILEAHRQTWTVELGCKEDQLLQSNLDNGKKTSTLLVPAY